MFKDRLRAAAFSVSKWGACTELLAAELGGGQEWILTRRRGGGFHKCLWRSCHLLEVATS